MALSNAPLSEAMLNGVSLTDVNVQADIALAAVGQYAGLAARYSGPGDSNMYWGAIGQTGANSYSALIYKNVGGVWTLLASQSVNSGTGHLAFSVIGDSLKLFLGTTLVASTFDSSITTPGSMGMRSNGVGTTFDRFSAFAFTPDGLPYTDSFNVQGEFNQISTSWREHAGNFTQDGITGKAVSNAALSEAMVSGVPQTNVFVQANIALSAVGQYAGLAARYNGPGDSNMYWGAIGQTGANSFSALIFKNVGGAWSQLASQAVSSGTGLLRFEVVGESLKLFLANTLVAYAVDASITRPGSVGMRSAGVGTTFDNYSANSLTPPVVPPTYADDFTSAGPNNQLTTNWQEHAGNFTQNGFSGKAGSSAAISEAMLNGVAQKDVYVQADIDLTQVGQYAGLTAHYSGPGDSNMYWGAIGKTGSNSFTALIFKNVGGVWSQLASQAVNSGTGMLRFAVVGESLKLSLGNALVASTFDSSITAAGSVGIRSGGVGTTFDNFSASVESVVSLTYGDGFDAAGPQNQLSTNWQEHAGNFTQDGTGLGLAVSNASLSEATLSGVSAKDVFAIAAINLTAIGQYAGVVARYSGPGDTNMYWGAIGQTAANTYTALIYKNVGGVWTPLASKTVNSGAGNVLFQVVGESLRLFFNDILVVYANDTSIAGPGSIGIRSGGMGTAFNSFLGGALTSAAIPFPISDNFNAAAGQLSPNWINHVGNFSQTGTRAVNNAPLSAAMFTNVPQAEVFVQAEIALSAVGQSAGLAARYSGPGDSNLYWGAITQTGASSYLAEIFKNVRGNQTQLVSRSTSLGTGLLRFEVVGESLKLFLGNNLVAFANDTSITAAGSVGMRAVGVGTTFDTFSAGLLTPPSVTLGYTESFPFAGSRNQLSANWQEHAGNFLQDGSSSQQVTGTTNVSAAMLNGVAQTDVRLTALTKLTAIGQYAGLAARYTGPGDSNMYWGAFGSTGPTSWVAVIYKNVGGVWTQLASQPINLGGSNSTSLAFEVVGNSLKLYQGNTLVAFAFDSSITGPGAVGLRVGGGGGFSSFSATALTQSPATLPFTDPFNSAAPVQLQTPWQERTGNFVTSPPLLVSKTALDVATLNGVSQKDVFVQADITLSAVGQYAGLSARYSGPGDSNMYWGAITQTGANSFMAVIYVNVRGTWTLLASQSVSTGTGKLRFEVEGTKLRLFLQNVLVLSASDSSLMSAGSVGIRSGGLNVVFDNFSAGILTPP